MNLVRQTEILKSGFQDAENRKRELLIILGIFTDTYVVIGGR